MGDIAIVFSVFIFAYIFRVVIYEGGDIARIWGRLSWLVFAAILVHMLSFYIFELYNIEKTRPDTMLFLLICVSVLFAVGLIAVASYLFPGRKLGRVVISFHIPLLISFVFLWRKLFFAVFLEGGGRTNLAFFDSDPSGGKINDLIKMRPLTHYHLSAVITEYKDDTGVLKIDGIDHNPCIEDFFMEGDIRIAVLSEAFRKSPELHEQLLNLKYKGIEVYDFTTFDSKLTGKIPVTHTSTEWLLFAQQDKTFRPPIYRKAKQLFDFFIASVGILLTLPAFIVIAFAIRVTSKGPVFFRQERLGLDKKPFELIKFRTMVDNAEQGTGPKWSSKNDPRITPLGRFLRKTRLDELPQLLNILKGEMSFVGPRPIRKHFADRLGEIFPFYQVRFVVKPGVTGWAQVNGDYAGSEEGQLDKLEYELFYIQNQTLFLDIYIFLKTIQTILFRRGE